MTGKASSTSIHSGDQLDKLSLDPAEETLASEPAETHEAAEPPGQSRDDQETLLEREIPDPVVVSLEPAMLRLETEPSSLPVLTLVRGPQEQRYKAAVYAELQKFGKTQQEYRQLSLTEEAGSEWNFDALQFLGLTRTVEEDRALEAVQKLLAATDYKGNMEPVYLRDPYGYQWEGYLPVYACSQHELLLSYGLVLNKSGQFNRHQRDRAIEALITLATEARPLNYDRKRFEGGREVVDRVILRDVPYKLIESYEGLAEGGGKVIRAGERPGRMPYFIIKAGPLLMDSLETFYTLKPANLHETIEEYLAGLRGKRARVPRSYSLFIQYLHTVDFAEFKVTRDLLVDRLLLASYRDQRKLKQAYQQISECLEVACGLGYVLDHRLDDLGNMLTMKLNPAKLSRVQARLEREQKREAARQEKQRREETRRSAKKAGDQVA